MRGLILVVALAGCSKKQGEEPPPPPPAKAIDVCDVASKSLEHVTCSGSGIDVAKAKKTFDGFLDITRKATDSNGRQFQVMCAQMFQALEKDMTTAKCTVDVAAADRAQVKTLLESYYAERTQIVKTGDAAVDTVIAHIGEIRDSMCACSTMTCLEVVDKQLDSIGALPPTASDKVKQMGTKLLDDVGRCEAKIRNANGI